MEENVENIEKPNTFVVSHPVHLLILGLVISAVAVLSSLGTYFFLLPRVSSKPDVTPSYEQTAEQPLTQEDKLEHTNAATQQITGTAQEKTYTVKTLGLEFRLPAHISQNVTELEEHLIPGNKGNNLVVNLSRNVPTVTSYKYNQYAGDNTILLMDALSTDYEAAGGRGGMFTDLHGYTLKDGKYYGVFLKDIPMEIPSQYVEKVPNTYVDMIKVKNTPVDQGGPTALGTLDAQHGWIGVLINIHSTTYTGIGMRIKTDSNLTEQDVDNMLASFRFK